MKKTLKKTLAILVAILMFVTTAPFAFAAEDLTDDITSVTLKDTDNDGYYEIATADELKAFANLVNAGNTAIKVELTADIVLNENVITEDGQLSDNSESFDVWVPIGNSDVKYTGVFDGARHVISGLYYKGNGEYAGLFGAIDGKNKDKNIGAIRDLYLIDSYFDIESSDRWFRVGGLAGFSYYANFDNCYVEAQFNLRSTYQGPSIYVGGISGMSYSTAENCFSDLGVSIAKDKNASAPWVGGIFGNASSSSVIKNCHTNLDSISTGNPEITNSTASRTAEEFENGTLCSLVGFHPCESTEGKNATCTEVGWKVQEYCTVCDYTTPYSEIPATGHTLTSVKAKAPTCTEVGYEAYEFCENCDYTTYSEIAANGHEIVTVKAKVPTCTKSGYEAYEYCADCDYTTYVEVAANGHAIVTVDAKTPTCTEAGYEAYEHCTACDYTTYEEIPALGHTFSADGICQVCEAECAHESVKDGKCDDCGMSVWMVTLKLTDSYGDGWNNNAIRLVAGENTIGEYTIDTGKNAEHSFVIEKGMYSFQWVKGNYSYECSFEIIVDGVTVVTVAKDQYENVKTGYEILNTYNLCEHKDENDDHDCDICGLTIYCTDENKNHECDICGEILECTDGDLDSFCDICEKYMEAGVKAELEYVDDYAYPNDIYTAFTDEEPENLFDGNNFNKLCIKFGETTFSEGCDYYTVEFRTADGSEVYVVKYDFVTANDEKQRDPKSWKLYGSDDGESWTLIDERTNKDLTQERNATESFVVDSTNEAYSYFKLEIHDVREEVYYEGYYDEYIDNSLFQLSELSLYIVHNHSWADGKCEICRVECEHETYTDGKCNNCGYECEHSYTDGVCDECGYECPHAETYETVTKLEHFSVQNPDGTWTKATVGVVCWECYKILEEKEADRADYTEFDEIMAKICEYLDSGKLIDNAYNSYSSTINSFKNNIYIIGSPFQSTADSYVESLKYMLNEIEAGIADGTMIKADFTYMTSLFDEINALIDNDPNKLTPDVSGMYNGIYNSYYKTQMNNNNHSQASYNMYRSYETDLENLIAAIKDGSKLKADYTETDAAIAALDEKLADVNLTDEAKAELEAIKKQLTEMKKDPLSSKADVEELMNALDSFEEAVEDGSAVKVNGFEEIDIYAEPIEQELKEKYGEAKYQDVLNSMTDEAKDEVKNIKDEAEALEGSVKDNEEKLNELKARVEAIFAKIEDCLAGTHNGLNYKVTEEAKCEVNAIESATCPICGDVFTREVENSALAHSFSNYEVVDAPACGVEGKKVAACDNGCNATDEKVVDALTHSFTEYTYNKDATCTADGTKTAACDHNCGATDIVTAEGTMLTHTDADEDFKCDNGCGYEFENPADTCEHMCHKTGIMGILWKIVQFFSKLFKINPVCECGVAHY